MARFSVPVQTVPGSHNGYRVLSGVKRPVRGVDHPTLSSTEVKERVKERLELYLCSPFGPSFPVLE